MMHDMMKQNKHLKKSILGQQAEYHSQYNPDILFSITRKNMRDELGIADQLPFYGFDCWNHYEVSWLNAHGKPIAATAEISYNCDSPCLIESKSMKLYFNSFNNSKFANIDIVAAIVKKDIAVHVGADVSVKITPLHRANRPAIAVSFVGTCLDELDIECTIDKLNPLYLQAGTESVEEDLYSNLLKSNCPVTNQPDWASVQIAYKGKKINHTGLLRYLVSYRNHQEFHELCVERIFMDILRHCQPAELTVYARYTRRGGLDINPYRSTKNYIGDIVNQRLYRQ